MKSKTGFTVLLVLCCGVSSVLAADYYVSNSGDDGNAGRSPSSAWKTLQRLHEFKFSPGDTIHLKCGDSWKGRLRVTASGAAKEPITFTSYGRGPFPKLSNPDWDYDWDGNVMRVEGSYVVVERLHFHDGPAHPREEDKGKHQNVYDMGAVNLTLESSHCLIRYCEFENYPIGVQSQGRSNRIHQNYIHDCTIAMCPPHWGPIGIFVGGPRNELSYNYVINYKGGGSGGFDGGAIEHDRYMWGHIGFGADHVKIHHNITLLNAGFLEPEAKRGTAGNRFLECYSNFVDEYKWAVSDDDLHDSVLRNNTILRYRRKKNRNSVMRIAGYRNEVSNNLFVLGQSDRKAFEDFTDQYGLVHRNNLYYSHDGEETGEAMIGIPKDPSEEIVSSWKKLSPAIYDSTGRIRVPRPDSKGVLTAWVPTNTKYRFESFSITLPQSIDWDVQPEAEAADGTR